MILLQAGAGYDYRSIILVGVVILIFLIYKAIKGYSYLNHKEAPVNRYTTNSHNKPYSAPAKVQNYDVENRNILNSIFTKRESYLFVILLDMIRIGSENETSLNIANQNIKVVMLDLGIDENSFTSFMKSINIDYLPQELSKFSQVQSELCMLYVHEILTCNGQPTEKEYQHTLNILRVAMSISESWYLRCLNKFEVPKRHFYPRY